MYPRLLQIYGPICIHSYGFMIAVGFLVFLFLANRHFKKYRMMDQRRLISSELFLNTIFLGLISGIIGGRLFFVISEWQNFSGSWLEIFYPWVGGFGILGSIIGVLIATSIYLKIKKIPILPVFDGVSIYAPLLQSISRIGCFLAGCCHGYVVNKEFLFAVKFTDPSGLAPLNVWLHPTQLYSSFASLVIFFIMYFIFKFFYKCPGQLVFIYLILESISRFSVDFWRGDRDFVNYQIFTFNLSSSQIVAICLFLFALVGLFFVCRKKFYATI